MRLSLLTDKILRVCAILSAIAAAPVVLVMSAFASDSGTVASTVTGLAVIGVGWSLLLAVVILSFRFRRPSTETDGQSAFWTGVVYLFGAAGLAVIGSQLLYRIRTTEKYQEVATENPNYPMTNSQSGWNIQVTGALPDSTPLEFVEAKYIVGGKAMDLAACRTDSAHGELPLMHTERIAVARSGGRYQTVVLADKYSPGRCGWHLRNIGFVIQGSEVPAWVNAYSDHNSIDGPSSVVENNTRIDLWCESHFSYPGKRTLTCNTFTNLRPELARKIPDGHRSESFDLAAFPDSSPREVNFYDLAAAAGGRSIP